MIDMQAETQALAPALGVRRNSGWWAMWALIATEGSLFAYLLFSYGYLAVLGGDHWWRERPQLRLALPGTLLLLGSSGVLWWTERALKAGYRQRALCALAMTIAMGSAFVGMQWIEWHQRSYSLADGAYASSYFTTTGFHMAHVAGGLLMLATVWTWMLLGYVDARRSDAVAIVAMYWHFVDLVWLAVFGAFYVWPLVRG